MAPLETRVTPAATSLDLTVAEVAVEVMEVVAMGVATTTVTQSVMLEAVGTASAAPGALTMPMGARTHLHMRTLVALRAAVRPTGTTMQRAQTETPRTIVQAKARVAITAEVSPVMVRDFVQTASQANALHPDICRCHLLKSSSLVQHIGLRHLRSDMAVGPCTDVRELHLPRELLVHDRRPTASVWRPRVPGNLRRLALLS